MVLIAGGATGLLLKHNHDVDVREQAAATAVQEAADTEQAAADAETVAQETADQAERDSRSELVTYLEKRITKDAKGHVTDGMLDGPIKYSTCTATGGGSSDDLTALTGTFECIAVNKENDDGTVSGYSYAGTAEWATGSITWKLGS